MYTYREQRNYGGARSWVASDLDRWSSPRWRERYRRLLVLHLAHRGDDVYQGERHSGQVNRFFFALSEPHFSVERAALRVVFLDGGDEWVLVTGDVNRDDESGALVAGSRGLQSLACLEAGPSIRVIAAVSSAAPIPIRCACGSTYSLCRTKVPSALIPRSANPPGSPSTSAIKKASIRMERRSDDIEYATLRMES